MATRFLVPVLLLALPLPVVGQVGPAPAPAARSHEGFFLRFLAGGGSGSLVLEDAAGTETTFSSSSGGSFHIQVGGAVRPNLVLFADLGGFSMIEPDIESSGITLPGESVEVTSSGIGAGLSYYLEPSNIYVSGSVLMSVNYLTFQGDEGESEAGTTFFLAAGKEWWVGTRWGLGVALLGEFGTAKDQADPAGFQAGIRTRMVGLAFSATLN